MKRLISIGFGMMSAAYAETSNFEKDRQAILSMAGKYEVTFHFRETVSLSKGYEVKEGAYEEKAHELVKVVEDDGERIVLQHILQVGPAVVKHWAQIWTYEDSRIIEFRGNRVWGVKDLSEGEVKGSWSQKVTQVDDSPRYEGVGVWKHEGGVSEWAASAPRPLPRREATKRSDYQVLRGVNRHVITPDGWVHEQDNTKWVVAEDGGHPLCREFGLNRYRRDESIDLSKAENYWSKTSGFWKEVRDVWDELAEKPGPWKIPARQGGVRLQDLIRDMTDDASEGKAPSEEKVREALAPFVVEVEP